MEEKYLKYSHNQFIFIVFVPVNHCWIWKDAFLKGKYMPRCLNGSSKMTVVAPFCEKFSSRVDKRLLVYAKDLRKDGQTILLPVYISAAPITNNPFSAALSVG